jgi:hypothetical protein
MSARRSTSTNGSLTLASEHAISTRIAGPIRKPLKAREVEGKRRDVHAPGGLFRGVYPGCWGDSSLAMSAARVSRGIGPFAVAELKFQLTVSTTGAGPLAVGAA